MTTFEAITKSKEALAEFLTQFNDIAFFVSEETCKRCCNRICDKCSKTIDENMNEIDALTRRGRRRQLLKA